MRVSLFCLIALFGGLACASADLRKLEGKLPSGLKWKHEMRSEVEVKPIEVKILKQSVSGNFKRKESLSYKVRVMADEKLELAIANHQIEIDGEKASSGLEGKKGTLQWKGNNYVPSGIDWNDNMLEDERRWLIWLNERPYSWSYDFLMGDAEVRKVSEKWTVEGEGLSFEGFNDVGFKGVTSLHYLRDTERDGVQCAELEIEFSGTGKFFSKRPGKAKITMKGRIFCDLETRLVKEGHYTGDFSMEIPENSDGHGSGTTEQSFDIFDKITYLDEEKAEDAPEAKEE